MNSRKWNILEHLRMKATEQETKIKQLAQEIIEYGRMNRFGPCNILIDVGEAAFRLRESPRDVRRALYLLETDGTAERIEPDDLWQLRFLETLSQGNSDAKSKAS